MYPCYPLEVMACGLGIGMIYAEELLLVSEDLTEELFGLAVSALA